MKAAGRPPWFRVANNVVSEASHSITKGIPSSIGRKAANYMSLFNILNALIASEFRGKVVALSMDESIRAVTVIPSTTAGSAACYKLFGNAAITPRAHNVGA